jgi:hypothetical protein
VGLKENISGDTILGGYHDTNAKILLGRNGPEEIRHKMYNINTVLSYHVNFTHGKQKKTKGGKGKDTIH